MMHVTLLSLSLLALAGGGGAQDTVVVKGPPRVEIGASPSDAHDQLYDVGRVLRTSAGGFVVVEATAGRLRHYDAKGAFVRDLGRRGDGPGEFQDIVGAALNGDTVLVLDRDGRVTRMTLAGTVLETWRPSLVGLVSDAYNPVPAGVLADGRLIVRANERVFGRPDGTYVRHAGFLTVGRRGKVDTLAFVASEQVQSEEGMPQQYRPWVEADWTAGGGAVWVTAPPEARIQRVGSKARIAVSGARRAPTQDDLDRFRDDYLVRGRSANDRRVIATWVDESPVAERVPPFRRVTVDGRGRVWVERWPAGAERTDWDVFDTGGGRLGTVRIPLELRLEDAGDGWILGVWADPLGVERVRLYDLPEWSP